MIKKYTYLLAPLLLVLFLAGCSADAAATGEDAVGAGNAGAPAAAENTGSTGNETTAIAGENPGNAGSETTSAANVDIDLTELSTTMMQARFHHILSNAEDYLGQTIRVRGQYHNMPFGDEYLHFVMIIPGDECCRMGFEFMRAGDYVYPDDFPAQYGALEIKGVLTRGFDGTFGNFLYLAVDDVFIIG
ncbi:MAG: hypothetical protein FWB75_00285 [Oscillospiraceae bacterium]|nr:hypothetical protein [Oscillospiraceae bacterium]